jgi:carbon-monoxide dehydrogenase medium subunit
VPLDRFYRGHLEYDLGAAELVTALRLPATMGASAFVKFGRRQASAPAVITVAARIAMDDSGTITMARIALGAAGPHPLRARRAEAALAGQPLDAASINAAAQAALEECDPATDALASAWYRRKMVGVFVRRTLERLQQPTQGESAAL